MCPLVDDKLLNLVVILQLSCKLLKLLSYQKFFSKIYQRNNYATNHTLIVRKQTFIFFFLRCGRKNPQCDFLTL